MKQDPLPQPSRAKFLLVDDLEENLLALSALLRRDDVELLTARGGAEALELLLVHDDIALALLDVQMPGMDGFELAELMRGSERTKHIPIIFVTAGAHDPHRIFKGYDSGAVDFLFKPIEAHILKSKADVFYRLHAQKQLLEQHLAERAETLRLHEMFTAVLGHDLRGPISAIVMSAAILSRRPEESVQKVGERLVRSGQWMGRMIEDMLDLARSRLAGGMPIARKTLNLGQPLERVVQERQSTFPERRIEVRQRGDLVGAWDEDRLTQAISNLLGNALHHGQPEVPVLITLDGEASCSVVLTISNGGAIPEEIRPRLFDPFRRGSERSGRAEGLGLGLYIVQQIVLAHGGSIDLLGGDAELTTFKLTLPRG
ncbi:ATP-binding protein [Rhodoferax sp.]|uniref:hybrid sensor histidine kinase/response regulator n=1 Tax=Rhodoferax sp. TaxID=50421 RepID=UPI00374C9EB5